MTVATIDDLPDAEWPKVEAALTKFRAGNKNRENQHILYEVLTNAGLSAEYADEFINLEMES